MHPSDLNRFQLITNIQYISNTDPMWIWPPKSFRWPIAAFRRCGWPPILRRSWTELCSLRVRTGVAVGGGDGGLAVGRATSTPLPSARRKGLCQRGNVPPNFGAKRKSRVTFWDFMQEGKIKKNRPHLTCHFGGLVLTFFLLKTWTFEAGDTCWMNVNYA